MTINNAEKSNKGRFLFIESWFENTSTELSQPCSNQIYVNMFAQNSKRTVAYLVLLSDGSSRVFVPGQCNNGMGHKIFGAKKPRILFFTKWSFLRTQAKVSNFR